MIAVFLAIYGNRIVWSANYNESTYNYSIYMRDISTSTQAWITEGENPEIYDTKIVYSANGRETRDIFIYDITTRKIELVSPYSSDLNNPHMYGNKVIWSNFYTRSGFIQMYDLVTKKAIDVTSDNTANTLPEYANYSYVDAGDDTGTHVDINGDNIVYSKSRDDQFGYAGVYVYNVSTEQSAPVYIYPDGTPTTPDIYNDTIVWGMDGNYGAVNDNGIYISDLSATNTFLPIALFTANITSGTVPLNVSFTDNSIGTCTSWIWDFGDGKNSTDRNPVHEFTDPGNYTVNLTVTNEKGTASTSATITVYKKPEAVIETPITTSGFAMDPDIYGDRIIWKESQSEKYSIHMYDLSTKKETQITTDGSPSSLAIYGNRIVWDNSSDFNIYMHDLSTHKETRITTSGGISPAIYGDRIVYEAIRNANSFNIYMYDLSTSKETQVTTSGLAQSPDINGDRIVYQADRNGKNDIYMYDLSTKKEIQITTGGLEYGPEIYGDRILWVDAKNGWDKLSLYMYDLSTSTETQVAINTTDGALIYDIYGDRIVWEEDHSTNRNIYMYNISTSKITPVTTSGLARNPKIYGDRIVYQVDRNGKYDIYMATIISNPLAAKSSENAYEDSSSSGGSSGSSSGGGAGGSPEPAKNVQVKELSQAFITNGKPVKFDFAKNATCVVYVSFDAKKTCW